MRGTETLRRILGALNTNAVNNTLLAEHEGVDMSHTEKVVDGIPIKYPCWPCPECKGKLEEIEAIKSRSITATEITTVERMGQETKRQKAKLQAAEEMGKALNIAHRSLTIRSIQQGGGDRRWTVTQEAVDAIQAALTKWEKAGKEKG